ncbi:MAG: beta-propeller domain-containing protein [Desulfurococcaceae archaeon]
MDRRLALFVSIALLTGVVIPIAAYLAFNVLAQMNVTTRILPVPTTPSSGERGAESELSSYEELVELLSRTLNYKKHVASLLRLYYTKAAVPVELPAITDIQVFGLTTSRAAQALQETATTRVSWTNVQVAGIDEPDIVKANEKIIATASSREVFLVSVQGKKVVGNVVVEESSIQGLFLRGNRLVIIARSIEETKMSLILGTNVTMFAPSEYTSIYVVDVSDPEEPNPLTRIRIGGSLLSARLLGEVVYVVANQPAVEGESELLIPVVNARAVSAENIIITGALGEVYANILSINVTGLEYAVRSVLMPAGSRLYMSYEKLYIVSSTQPSIVDLYRNVVEAAARLLPLDVSGKIKVYVEGGDLTSAYSHLVEYINGVDKPEEFLEKVRRELELVELSDYTHIYVLGVRGLGIDYIGSVTVEGRVLDQFAIEEYDGYFVVATTVNSYKVSLGYVVVTSQLPSVEQGATILICRGTECVDRTVPVRYVNVSSEVMPGKNIYMHPYVSVSDSDNRVYVVSLDSLTIRGVLKHLASGERIYAARLIKNTLFLVTFRQVDPLFAIDLSNPENPKVLGYLKIPGFSEYLHPLPGDTLLGVGREDPSNLKISLFDVKNPANMSEVVKIVINMASSPALQDHHAVTVDPDYNHVYIPIALYRAMRGEEPTGIAVVYFENSALQLKAILSHPGATRALYIGNELYTVSSSSIRVFNVESLELILEIPLK